jgi:hypothetical protein
MKILSKNTSILNATLEFNEDNTEVSYQATTLLYVEGNIYEDLVTPKTIPNLKCATSDIVNIQAITEAQIATWVEENYPAF